MDDEVTTESTGIAPEPTSSMTATELLQWYKNSEEASEVWRKNAKLCKQYVDGNQWTDEDKKVLEDRGSPCVTINMIAGKKNYLVGGEVSSRIDPKALPRTEHEDDAASAITDALRVAAGRTQGRFDQARTAVAEDFFVTGLSGMVVGLDRKNPNKPRITLTHTPSDRLFFDPHARCPWFSDAAYVGFVTWMDVSAAKRMKKYQGKESVIDGAIAAINDCGGMHDDKPSGFWYDKASDRIKIMECYWEESGQWWFAHFVASSEILIGPKRVPFLDEDGNSWCPLKLVSAYIDENNDRFGPIKDLLSPQDEVNKRRSQGLHLLVSEKVIHEEGTLLPNKKGFATEMAKPDGMPSVAPGALSTGSVQVQSGQQLSMGHVSFLQEAKSDIDAIGPSAQQLVESGSSSGLSVMRRKDIANIPLRPLFANLSELTHNVFTALWHLIRQFWTEEMWLRVTDDDEKQGYRFVGLNRRTTIGGRVQELLQKGVELPLALEMSGLDDMTIGSLISQAQQMAQMQVQQQAMANGVQSPEQIPPEVQQQMEAVVQQMTMQLVFSSPIMSTPFVANNVANIGVDIEISSTPDIGIVQQEQHERIADMASKGVFNPAITPLPVMKMLIRSSELRDKDKLLRSLEDMNEPQQDPAAAQAQAMQMQMQMQAMQAELAKTIAEVENIKADTAKTVSEIPGVEASAQLNAARAVSQSIEAGRSSVPNLDHGQDAQEQQRSM